MIKKINSCNNSSNCVTLRPKKAANAAKPSASKLDFDMSLLAQYNKHYLNNFNLNSKKI